MTCHDTGVPLILKVLLPLPLPPFDYAPPHGAEVPEPGRRVVVPWQQRLRIGIVVGVVERQRQQGELKEIIGTLDGGPFLTDAALTTIERVAAHTCVPPGTVLANLLATGLSEPLGHEVRAVLGVKGVPLGPEWCPATTLEPGQLELYRQQGLIEERVRVILPTVTRLVARRPPDEALTAKQRQALATLVAMGGTGSAAAVARQAGVSERVVRTLVHKGYAEYHAVPELPPLPAVVGQAVAPVAAIPPETTCLEGGRRRQRLAALLPRLKATVDGGGSALVLVPEQALIAETAGALATAVPVAVLSGELTDAQRRRLWQELPGYGPVVLVGTYLALLAPLAALQQVVVLEAGSPSYKLSSGCRVFVPTAARFLAEAAGATLLESDVLASSEMRLRTGRGCYQLPRPKPRVHVVDLNRQANWPLSADLMVVLKQVAERGRQAVLLAPRRGFSAGLSCRECSYVAMCPHCDLPLRYHREGYRLRCHQCGFDGELPLHCPRCGGVELRPARAAGTQWIYSAVKALLPDLTCLRFDSDRRDELTSLYDGQAGVVVGTTALLRQPPLPNVALLAVTLLDTLLYVGDYRSEEETLRLLLNLAEVAGEQRPLTVIQTFQPDHPLIGALKAADGPARFVEQALSRRRQFRYPPYALLAKVQVSARERAAAERAASWLAEAMMAQGAHPGELLGPSPAPVVRLKGLYTYQLLLRVDDERRLAELLMPVKAYRGEGRVRFEVDPRDIAHFLE